MKKKRLIQKSICIVLVSLLNISSVSQVQASEKSIEKNEENVDSESDEAAILEGHSNSWRYQDGERIYFDEPSQTWGAFQAWSKVDGHYINNRGEIIKGATAKGIDVSEWQGSIDWEKVKNTDIDFAIIRCGYGMNQTNQDDDYWKRNADECTRLGIPFGTYLYSYADSVERAKSEAQHVLRLVQGYDLEFPIYYDLEENSIRNHVSKEKIAEIAKTFCDIIEAAGYDAAIYANTDWFTNYLTDSTFDNMEKWVAQYNSVCTYNGEYKIWQCADAGVVDGISGKVDLNMYFGSEELVIPSPVHNLKASAYGKNKVKISWNPSEGADGYLIYAQKYGEYRYCGMTTKKSEFIDVKALDEEYNYYWVFPYCEDSKGNMFPGACAKYVYAKGIIPAVQNLKASSVLDGVKLTWNRQFDAEGYLVYGRRAGGQYEYIGMTSNATSFIDTKASKTMYNYYWVYPYHKSGNTMVVGGTPRYTYGRGL